MIHFLWELFKELVKLAISVRWGALGREGINEGSSLRLRRKKWSTTFITCSAWHVSWSVSQSVSSPFLPDSTSLSRRAKFSFSLFSIVPSSDSTRFWIDSLRPEVLLVIFISFDLTDEVSLVASVMWNDSRNEWLLSDWCFSVGAPSSLGSEQSDKMHVFETWNSWRCAPTVTKNGNNLVYTLIWTLQLLKIYILSISFSCNL